MADYRRGRVNVDDQIDDQTKWIIPEKTDLSSREKILAALNKISTIEDYRQNPELDRAVRAYLLIVHPDKPINDVQTFNDVDKIAEIIQKDIVAEQRVQEQQIAPVETKEPESKAFNSLELDQLIKDYDEALAKGKKADEAKSIVLEKYGKESQAAAQVRQLVEFYQKQVSQNAELVQKKATYLDKSTIENLTKEQAKHQVEAVTKLEEIVKNTGQKVEPTELYKVVNDERVVLPTLNETITVKELVAQSPILQSIHDQSAVKQINEAIEDLTANIQLEILVHETADDFFKKAIEANKQTKSPVADNLLKHNQTTFELAVAETLREIAVGQEGSFTEGVDRRLQEAGIKDLSVSNDIFDKPASEAIVKVKQWSETHQEITAIVYESELTNKIAVATQELNPEANTAQIFKFARTVTTVMSPKDNLSLPARQQIENGIPGNEVPKKSALNNLIAFRSALKNPWLFEPQNSLVMPLTIPEVGAYDRMQSVVNAPGNKQLFSAAAKRFQQLQRLNETISKFSGKLGQWEGQIGGKLLKQLNPAAQKLVTEGFNFFAKEGWQKGIGEVLTKFIGGTSLGTAFKTIGVKLGASTLGKAATGLLVKLGIGTVAAPGVGTAIAAVLAVGGKLLKSLKNSPIIQGLKNIAKDLGLPELPVKTGHAIIDFFGNLGALLGTFTLGVPIGLAMIIAFGWIGFSSLFIINNAASQLIPYQNATGGEPSGATEESLEQAITEHYTGEIPEGCPSGWPVEHAYITYGPNAGGTHSGNSSESIDFGITTATKVYATANGGVSCGYDPRGYGNFIKVTSNCQKPDGTTTVRVTVIYGHLQSQMNCGQEVSRGTLIGYSDNTGNSTGPHLHYEFMERKLTMSLPYIPTQIKRGCDSTADCHFSF